MSKSIKVELYIDERDFIIDLIDYGLSSTLISKLKKANHNKKRSIQDAACDLAERLETYEFELREDAV